MESINHSATKCRTLQRVCHVTALPTDPRAHVFTLNPSQPAEVIPDERLCVNKVDRGKSPPLYLSSPLLTSASSLAGDVFFACKWKKGTAHAFTSLPSSPLSLLPALSRRRCLWPLQAEPLTRPKVPGKS
eukprot:GHVU01209129.1.p2 GENE.GHVU01209129.1~~GHVU01209129.1.p2  ORF type:complete len:130 (-),score=6.88 GHVU01209129.1:1102-1491(-)